MLALKHPKHAALDCTECQRWVYDIKTVELRKRGGEPVRRSPGAPTPCKQCPKQSPERARRLKLSDRDLATINLFLRNRALFGRMLTDAEVNDPWLARSFSMLESVYRAYESSKEAQHIGLSMVQMMGTMKNG